MSKRKINALFDENSQKATKIIEKSTKKSVSDDENRISDKKDENPTKTAQIGQNDRVSDNENAKSDENACSPDRLSGEIAAENLALKAEIASLRGEVDALKARESELVRTLNEKSAPDYAAIAADELFADEYARRSEVIKDRIITDYLRSLSRSGGVRLLGETVGKTALAPLKKPKTLSEAKKLAELYIKD